MKKTLVGTLVTLLLGATLFANQCATKQQSSGVKTEKINYIKSFKVKTDTKEFKKVVTALTNKILENGSLETEKKNKQHFMKFHKALKLKTKIKNIYFTFEKEDYENKNLLFKKPFDVSVTQGSDKAIYVHYLDVCANNSTNEIQTLTINEIADDIEKSIEILTTNDDAFKNIKTITKVYSNTDMYEVTNKLKANIKKYGYKMIKHNEDFDGVLTVRACKEDFAREIFTNEANYKMAPIMPCAFTLQELENGDIQLSSLDFDWVAKNGNINEKTAKVFQQAHSYLNKIYTISK